MKNYIFLIFIFTSSIYSFSQCQKGDCKNGFSTMKYTDGTYEGYYKDGKLDSLGYMFYTDKKLYHGEFKNNQYNGNGYYKWISGSTFFGKWKNGLQSGLGIEKNASGSIVSAGEFLEGKVTKKLNSDEHSKNPKNCTGNCVDGIGKLMNIDSVNYLGVFKNKKIILGRIQSKAILYDGEIKNNLPNGYGQIKYLDTNEFFMGYFKEGKKHGAGIYTNKSNKKVFGKWKNDEYQDPTKLIYKDQDFCNELIALAKLTKKERKELKTIKKFYSTVTLEKKFLNAYKLNYEEKFNNSEKISFALPSITEGKITVKYNDLIKSCNKCKKLSKVDNTTYKYKDVELHIDKYSSGMTLTYPKPDPCISGNCKNGKGKRQYTTSVYEGQFKDGKAHGKGKEIWENGNIYEGEYLNDMRSGKGTFTWNEEKNKGHKYIGDFKNDLRNGQGIYTWPSGGKYIGSVKDNKFSGYGKRYDDTGNLFYDGNWVNSNYEGQGTYYYSDGGKYIGNWKESKREGLGKYYTKDGKINYEGEYKEGKANGKGKLYYTNATYEGELVDGKPNGNGKIIYNNGNSYSGEWKESNFHGLGTYIWKNGNKHIGEYRNGEKNGEGRFIWASGYYLIGDFKGGKFHGNCKEYFKDGKIAFEGEYVNGKANGFGKLYDNEGNITFEGQFKDGKKVE